MILVMRSLCRPPSPLHLIAIATTKATRRTKHSPFFTLRSNTIQTPHISSGLRKNRFGVSLRMSREGVPMSSTSSETITEEEVLAGKNDLHGGVIVELTNEPLDPSHFASLLNASLSRWRQQGKRGIWIKIPIELVNLIESAVKEGFYYHHAEPNYLMLVRWLPNTVNTIPANASHRLGIVACVMNEKNEVLVVQENSGRFRGTGIWKLPTGVVDEGEDVCNAAVREVKEETGIDTKFMEVLAFRQSHKSFFGKSDLFFVCMLQASSYDIVPQAAEIEAAQWMPFDRYAAQPFIKDNELTRFIGQICAAKKEGKYLGFAPASTVGSFSQRATYLYMNTSDLNCQ